MTAIIAHAPLEFWTDVPPPPVVVYWWQSLDDESVKSVKGIRRVATIADWKARFPKQILMPVEVSVRQWAIYQKDLAEKAAVPI